MPTERINSTIKLTVSPDDANPAESSADSHQQELPRFGENFSTIERIAEDRHGSLYRVRNEGMQKDFTVRLVHNEQLPTEEAKKSFLRYCRRYSTVTHPALLTMYSFAENEHGVWFVSDYCADPTLEDLIDRGDFKSEGKVLDVFEHLLETIEALHSVGIKFGATAPGSIYVQETSQGHKCRLRDWWALGLEQAHKPPLDVKAISHASPEQVEDNGALDLRSDVYSFGANLYEALTGRLPHREADGLKLAIKIISGTVPPVDGTFADSALAKIAMRCMSKSPEQRYQTFSALREDFKAVARGVQLPSNKPILTQPQQVARKWLVFWCAFVLSFWMFSSIVSDDFDDLSNLSQAVEAEDRGDMASAESLLLAATAEDPSDSYAWYNLGRVRLEQENYTLAREALQTSITLDPEFADAYDKLGELNADLGNVPESVANYEKAAQLNPSDPTAHGQLSVAYWRQDRLDDAIKSAQEAVRLGPDDSFAHYTLAFAYDEAGKYEEAAKEYEATLKIEPMYGDVLSNLSLVYSHLKDHDKALRVAETATSIDPSSAEYWTNLGHAYLRAGKLENAEINLRKALAIEPFKYKAMANLAEVMKKQGKKAEAKKLMKEVIE